MGRRLGGHFGEMGGQAGSSHTVEKCFAVADMTTKEVSAEWLPGGALWGADRVWAPQMIVAEVAMVERALKNTRHGPFLMRKLGVSL